jgi:hypothetical protein
VNSNLFLFSRNFVNCKILVFDSGKNSEFFCIQAASTKYVFKEKIQLNFRFFERQESSEFILIKSTLTDILPITLPWYQGISYSNILLQSSAIL